MYSFGRRRHERRRQCRLMLIFLCAAFVAPGLWAQETAEKPLAERLLPLIEAHEGEVAVSVRHIGSGEEFHYRSDVVMPTASLIKLPVMIEAYRQAAEGIIDLQATVKWTDADKVPGSGILTKHFTGGSKLSLRDLIRLMIAYSDNTATNLVVDRIGLDATARAMASLGFPETRLHSKVYRGGTSIFPDRSQEYGLGSTRTTDMVELLERIHRRQLVTPEACDEMMEHLLACEDRSKLPRLLPEQIKIAHKTGAVSAARCDAGLLLTPDSAIAICVLTRGNTDRRWTDDNAADLLCARIGRLVFEHFAATFAPNATKNAISIGDFGEIVEALQRTLNARLDPSPRLSIDGDFGPATQAALIRFQESKKLQPTGIAGPESWKSLSPLITESSPVPQPEVVNQQTLPTEPADQLNGPPIVSCKAWAIADGTTGGVLWSAKADERLHFASTTKIMTAYVVLRLAQQDSAVLEETVVFSRRADRTRGSTAGIREGEQLSVREVLYGLLLPSGNDASVALAEHFGNRFGDAGDQTAGSFERFIIAMNRTATELGMTKTVFRNPHGLPHEEHLSSAADLLILARHALHIPAFQKYVSTRQRGCEVQGPGGYTRNVMWKNTNRLLSIAGYHGVKTGTTSQAGACLVSQAKHGDRKLLLVVLGAASSAGRYVDSRNLYRWARRRLADGRSEAKASESDR
ncbi:MAG: hypothetical protein GY903_21880 [Fuerstiella sp.]|nr:hypothetical protein [Fuerstiella sp.]